MTFTSPNLCLISHSLPVNYESDHRHIQCLLSSPVFSEPISSSTYTTHSYMLTRSPEREDESHALRLHDWAAFLSPSFL